MDDGDDAPALDAGAFDNLGVQLGAEVALRLSERYFLDAAELLATVSAAAGDPARREDLRSAAHDLKSTAALFGLRRTAGLARRLEQVATSGAGDGPILAVKLAAAADEGMALLRTAIARMGSNES